MTCTRRADWMERTSLGSPSNRIKALNRVGKEYEYAISNPTAKMSFSQNDEMSVKLRINDGSIIRTTASLLLLYLFCLWIWLCLVSKNPRDS